MSTVPSTAAPAKPPGQTGGTGVPEGIARFLFLLRWIIGYGKNLADTFQQRPPDAAFRRFAAIRFRTSDLGAILARLRRGLMLAMALEAKLARRAAAGRDIPEAPVRYSTSTSRRPGTARKPRAARRTNIIDLPLDRLPTTEQIAEELRRRPFGAILVDICRDLGVLPGDLTREQQHELLMMVTRYGGNMVVLLFKDMNTDLRRRMAEERGGATPATASAGPPRHQAACPTGPPDLAVAA